MFLINIATIFLERKKKKKKQVQAAAHKNQEIYLDLASFPLLKILVRLCLNSNGQCILHLCKKEQI